MLQFKGGIIMMFKTYDEAVMYAVKFNKYKIIVMNDFVYVLTW